MGLILAALAVEFIANGIKGLFPNISGLISGYLEAYV